MNTEQFINEVYQNYMKSETDRTEKTGQTWTPLSIEEFINKIKTVPEFSEKWGLKIEERELSVIERILIAETNTEVIPGFHSHFDTDEDVHKVLDTWDVPTKLITLTYNNETIESYES